VVKNTTGMARSTAGLWLSDLARWPNPIVAGWMHYYGRYYRSALYPSAARQQLI